MPRYGDLSCFCSHYSIHLLDLYNVMHVGGENSTVLMEQIMIESVSETAASIVCAEGYYLSNDSLCRPLCSLWVDPPGVGLDSDNIAVIISAVIALFSSITAITLALTIQRSTM